MDPFLAGTYSKYDYLTSYTSNSKADTASSLSERTPYYKSSTYASVIDTDELTKNYFAKYYNKSSTSGTSNFSVLEREVNARYHIHFISQLAIKL